MGEWRVVRRSEALDSSNTLPSYETDLESYHEMGWSFIYRPEAEKWQQLDMRLKESRPFLLI